MLQINRSEISKIELNFIFVPALLEELLLLEEMILLEFWVAEVVEVDKVREDVEAEEVREDEAGAC